LIGNGIDLSFISFLLQENSVSSAVKISLDIKPSKGMFLLSLIIWNLGLNSC